MKCLYSLLLCLALVSCSTVKENNLAYFKNLPVSATGTLPSVPAGDITLQLADEVTVTVSSLVPEATAMFNAPQANAAPRGELATTAMPRLATHVVDSQGCITLPVIGRLHVAGLTTAQVEQAIRERVGEQVRDPFVQVQLVGFFVNVMGEVRQPRRVSVTRERYTVLDALADCGDLTEWGQRDGVIVIRRALDGGSTFYRLNLADTQLMTSPAFFLQQNDVVYVEPNKIKIDNSKYNQNNAYKLSVISTIVSASSVLVSLVIALAVK
ncbi:MAG: polysaccharide biosynthesis/export family protein [Muribaculaceae bacterium]|nr:polysaccharide biosynthesis/export family protein [Muribaculaceae bacterium]